MEELIQAVETWAEEKHLIDPKNIKVQCKKFNEEDL